VPLVDAWAAAARSVNKTSSRSATAEPIARPADARYILKHCRSATVFYGASSWSGCRPRWALTETTRKFKKIRSMKDAREESGRNRTGRQWE